MPLNAWKMPQRLRETRSDFLFFIFFKYDVSKEQNKENEGPGLNEVTQITVSDQANAGLKYQSVL